MICYSTQRKYGILSSFHLNVKKIISDLCTKLYNWLSQIVQNFINFRFNLLGSLDINILLPTLQTLLSNFKLIHPFFLSLSFNIKIQFNNFYIIDLLHVRDWIIKVGYNKHNNIRQCFFFLLDKQREAFVV